MTQLLTTHQVAARAGVHRLTLLRWLREGRVPEPGRDRRGWRVFSEKEAMTVVAFADRASGTTDQPEDPRIGNLQALDWDFHGAKTSYLTHGLHPYPAKFIPQIPNALIQELSSVGETVADIFCGSGTTLLEAVQLKRHAVGIDANPLAALISRAKTAILGSGDFQLLIEHLHATQERVVALKSGTLTLAKPPSRPWRPAEEVCEFWFDPHVVEELADIRQSLTHLPPAPRLIASVAFSSIIVAVSHQDSDTRYVRRSKGLRIGDTTQRYVSALSSAIDASKEVSDVLEDRFKCDVLSKSILDAPEVGNIDLMVTSPPYPNAFSYHLYHRTRMLWLGHDAEQFKKDEIGSHRKYSKKGRNRIDENTFAREFETILRWLSERMRSGRYACFVIGDSTIGGRLVDNATLIAAVGSRCGFREAARIERSLQSTKKSFNPVIGKIRTEHILVLQRN